MATNATKVVAQNQATADLIFNSAKNAGFNDIQASALVANAIQESSLNASAKNFNPSSRDDSIGLFQLNFNGGLGIDFQRKKNLSIADAKILATDPQENVNFIIAEAKRKGFGSTRTAEEANRFLVKRVIRPANQETEIARRTAIQRQVEAELVRDPRTFGVNTTSVAQNTNDPDNFPDTRSNLSDENLETSNIDEGFRTTTIVDPVTGKETKVFDGKFQRGEERVSTPNLKINRGTNDDTGGSEAEELSKLQKNKLKKENAITTKPNILSGLATQTYKFTLFLQTMEQYRDMMLDPEGSKDTSQLIKIVESGGTGGQADTAGQADSPFKLDYYIDNVELEGQISGKSTSSPTNLFELNFDIIEPFGYRFFQELREATQKLGMVDMAKQHYLMVIEFRGEDEFGQSTIQKPGSTRVGGIDQGDQNQLAEKYIPFMFAHIKTELHGGAATYSCKALPAASLGLLEKFQVIPYNLEITGATLEDIFNSTAGDTQEKLAVSAAQQRKNAKAQSKVDQTLGREAKKDGKRTKGNSIAISATTAASQNTPNFLLGRQAGIKGDSTARKANLASLGFQEGTFIRTGVVDALNKFNREKLGKKGTVGQPDIFKVTFLDGIGNAELSQDSWISSHRDKTKYAMLDKEVKGTAEPEKNHINKTAQINTIQAGIKLVKLLEQCIRSSTYITEQSVKKIHPRTKTSKDNLSATGKPLVWFQITSRVLPYAYDEVRGCYAYEIEYIVNAKEIADAQSTYFLKKAFLGTHKKYDYWFTGKNTEVIEYKADLVASYFAIVTGEEPPVNQAKVGDKQAESVQPKEFKAQGVESQQLGGTNAIPGASAAGNLYSRGDYKTANIEIIGDPDYILQSEIFYPVHQLTPQPFIEQDGSINNTGSPLMLELNFKTMSDYNDQTGLADIQDLVVKSDAEVEATGTNGLIYQVNTFRCIFKGGTFTIECTNMTEKEFADTTVRNEQIRSKANLLPSADATKRVSRIDNTGSVLLQSRPGAAEKARLARGLGKKQVGGSQARITASNNVIPLNNVNVDATASKSTRRIKAPGFFTSVQGGNLPVGVVTVDNFRDANDDATGN